MKVSGTESVYNLKRTPGGYRMVKFDFLLNVQEVYNIRYSRGRLHCECFAANKPTCRHRDMIPLFVTKRAVDSLKFYCYETQQWWQPIKMTLH
jgi:hypothetical protein